MLIPGGLSRINKTSVCVLWVFSTPYNDLVWTHGIWVGRNQIQEKLEKEYPDRIFHHNETRISVDITIDEQEQKIREQIKEDTDIVITSSYSFTLAVQNLVADYPNISFISIAGPPKTVPNHVVMNLHYYEPMYLTAYVAGVMTKTNKVCFIKAYSTPQQLQMISSIYLGARLANPNVEINHITINTWGNRSKELGAVEILRAQGCDVVTGTTKDGSYHEISDLYSLGLMYDFGSLFGEHVLISSIPKWEYALLPMIIEAIELDQFTTSSHLFGMNDTGTPIDIGMTSLSVPKANRQFLKDLRESIVNGSHRVFCGPLNDEQGVQRIPAGYCLNNVDLNSMDYIIGENNVNLGNYVYPPDVCEAGTYYTVNAKENSHACISCPPGTFSKLSMRDSCQACGPSQVAQPGSSVCTTCPSGQIPNDSKTECINIQLQWYIWLIIGVCLVVFLIIFLLTILFFVFITWRLWRIVKNQRDTLENAENVSTSIALMQLENPMIIDFIKKKPSSHLNSQLVRIVQNLKQYRPYLPESIFATGDDDKELDLNLSNSSASTKNAMMDLTNVIPIPTSDDDSSSHRSKSSQRSISRIRERLQLGIVNRVATILVIDIKEFSRILMTTPPVQICNVFISLTDAILPIMKKSNGVYHSLIRDKLVCTWNAVSKVSNHQLHATAAALLIHDAVKSLHEKWAKSNLPLLTIQSALFTGSVSCGNLGTTKLRTFCLLGPSMEYAFSLVRLNSIFNSNILMNRDCYCSVKNDATAFIVDQMQITLSEGNLSGEPIDIFQLVSLNALSSKLSSWMSSKHCKPMKETPSRAQSLRVYNTAIQEFYRNDLSNARAFLEEVIRLENHAEEPIDHLSSHCNRFIRRIKNEQLDRNQFIVQSLPDYS